MIICKGNTNVFSLIQALKKIERDHGNLSICAAVYTMDHILFQKSSKWHRVEDGVRPQSPEILLYNERTLERGNGWVGLTLEVKAKWTHWRELPKPPEKAKEK